MALCCSKKDVTKCFMRRGTFIGSMGKKTGNNASSHLLICFSGLRMVSLTTQLHQA